MQFSQLMYDFQILKQMLHFITDSTTMKTIFLLDIFIILPLFSSGQSVHHIDISEKYECYVYGQCQVKFP